MKQEASYQVLLIIKVRSDQFLLHILRKKIVHELRLNFVV